MEQARPAPNPKSRRDRVLGWAFTASVHAAVLAALFFSRGTATPEKPEAEPHLTLVSIARTPEPPGPPDADKAASEAPPPPMEVPTPMPILVKVASPVPVDNSDILSEAQLAGAANADEDGAGGGGGGCDTARAVQAALRTDPLVRTAVADAGRQGKAIMMWNGDWVRSGAQEGKGLSAVRQAIMWKVAFSSESCRNQAMHGTVVLSLADGGTRFAIGTEAWRWSDLLGLKR
jgi:hypothetical protein